MMNVGSSEPLLKVLSVEEGFNHLRESADRRMSNEVGLCLPEYCRWRSKSDRFSSEFFADQNWSISLSIKKPVRGSTSERQSKVGNFEGAGCQIAICHALDAFS